MEISMQITLIQSEIETAIHDYINKRIRLSDDQSFKIELNATRGADGFKATIDIVDSNLVPALATQPPVPAATPAPSPEVPQVAQVVQVLQVPQTPAPAPATAAARPNLPPAEPVGNAPSPATATPAAAPTPAATPAAASTVAANASPSPAVVSPNTVKPLFGNRPAA